MSDSDDTDSGEDTDNSSAEGKREEIASILSDFNEILSNRVSNTAEVVDGTTDIGSYFDAVGHGAREVIQVVLDELSEYIRENDVQIELSGHKIHIEGDEEGLEKAEAKLQQALKDKDVEIQYHRDRGLDVKFGDG